MLNSPLCSPPTLAPFCLRHGGLYESSRLRENCPGEETGFLLKLWAVSGRETRPEEWEQRGNVYPEVSPVFAIHLFLKEGKTEGKKDTKPYLHLSLSIPSSLGGEKDFYQLAGGPSWAV